MEKYWLCLHGCEIMWEWPGNEAERIVLLITMRPHPPEREGDQLVNLVSPDEVHEGESLQVKDEHTRETPHRHLFCRLTVLLTLRAVPVCTGREDCQKVSFAAQHFWRYFFAPRCQ